MVAALAVMDRDIRGGEDIDMEYGVGYLPGYAAEMRRTSGYYVEVFTISADEMRGLATKHAEAAHAREQAQLQKADTSYARKQFVLDEVHGLPEKLATIQPDDRFYYGCVQVYPWGKSFVQAGPGVYATDAGHCTGVAKGIYIDFVGYDANRQMVPVMDAHFADNEGSMTWSCAMRVLSQAIPELNTPNTVISRDGKAEIATQIDAYLPSAKQFLCEKHYSDTIVKTLGQAFKPAYGRICHALTKCTYDFARAQAPPRSLHTI